MEASVDELRVFAAETVAAMADKIANDRVGFNVGNMTQLLHEKLVYFEANRKPKPVLTGPIGATGPVGSAGTEWNGLAIINGRAFDNLFRTDLSAKALGDYLQNAFNWRKTKQGFDYWEAIRKDLSSGRIKRFPDDAYRYLGEAPRSFD